MVALEHMIDEYVGERELADKFPSLKSHAATHAVQHHYYFQQTLGCDGIMQSSGFRWEDEQHRRTGRAMRDNPMLLQLCAAG